MPRQFTKPLDLYKHQMARFAMVQRVITDMHREIAYRGHTDAMDLTRGGVSSKQLRAMGHPYGRNRVAQGGQYRPGRKRGMLPSLPINKQSGGLRSRLRVVRTSGGIQAFKLTAGVHPGNWVLNPDGTRKMVGRGFFLEIKKRWRARNKALLDTVKSRQRNY